MTKFNELNKQELSEVNGGGIIGAAAGFAIGLQVGGAAVVATYLACQNAGESGDMAQKAILTSFLTSVGTCTLIGAVATGIV